MRLIITAIVSAAFGLGAFADPAAAEAKCVEAMTALSAENVEAGCACFIAALSETEIAEYQALDLSKWEDEASDELKEAGEACFPAEE